MEGLTDCSAETALISLLVFGPWSMLAFCSVFPQPLRCLPVNIGKPTCIRGVQGNPFGAAVTLFSGSVQIRIACLKRTCEELFWSSRVKLLCSNIGF